MSGGQQPRLEALLAIANGRLDIQRADDGLLGGTNRQFNQSHLPMDRMLRLIPVAEAALRERRSRVTAIRTARHHFQFRQQRRQRSRGSRLSRALLAADKHTSDAWIDGIKNQRQLHALLAYNSAERENPILCHTALLAHYPPPDPFSDCCTPDRNSFT